MAAVLVSQNEELKIPTMVRTDKTNMSSEKYANNLETFQKPCESLSGVQPSGREFQKFAFLFSSLYFVLPKKTWQIWKYHCCGVTGPFESSKVGRSSNPAGSLLLLLFYILIKMWFYCMKISHNFAVCYQIMLLASSFARSWFAPLCYLNVDQK